MHLGAVQDIAWGDWKQKETAVNKWLAQAAVLADDLVKNEGEPEEFQFRICGRALEACLGSHGKIDPDPWVQEALIRGQRLIASASDAAHKSQYQWDLGMVLYNAVQVDQMRGDTEAALKNGLAAAEYLEQGHRQKQTPSTAYVLGRLYFRLGSINSIRDNNHKQAIAWFEKAIPLLIKPLPPEAEADIGSEGETFVSMGVSYWETNQREKAVELTQYGIERMQEAVKQGVLEQSALATPYNNLAIMHRQLGSMDEANRYQTMAAKIRDARMK